jgi:hypothetical protein
MVRSARLAALLVCGIVLLTFSGTALSQPSSEGGGPPSIRIETPPDGSAIHTREPVIEVCVTGADEQMRASLKAFLDGEEITKAVRWKGQCAEWQPRDESWFVGKHHAWGEKPFDEDGWVPELREGLHEFEASVTAPSGGSHAKSKFRVETESHTATLGAGFPSMKLDGFDGRFAPVNLLEARFGRQQAWGLSRSRDVLRYKSSYFTVGAISTELAEEADPGETETTHWRGGLGERKGYGYRIGDNAFIAPYHGTTGLIAHLDVEDPPADPGDAHALETFDGSTNVATAFEGGFALGLSRSMTLDVGYEQMVAYPNWVVFPAVGAGVVHGIALHMADRIARHVARDSPRAAPIVSFILRNAISFAIYNQRRREVNWPFGGDPGVLTEGAKVSFTYSF